MPASQVKVTPGGPQSSGAESPEIEFSEIVQGYWRMGDWNRSAQDHLRFLKQHIELGITTVDHAHVYGSNPSCEELFGSALALDSSLREQIQIVSKCGIELRDNSPQVNHYNSTPSAITESVETSLRRLGVDNLDVLLLHRPDWLMDVDAVADCFQRLKTSGKVQHFGVSNFTVSQFSLLQSRLETPLVTNQVEINPLNMSAINDGTLDQLQQNRVRPMAWSCLAGGRVFSESSEQMSRLKQCLEQVAKELDDQASINQVSADKITIDQVLYAWVMALPSKPIVIAGSGNIERLKLAVNTLKLKLTQEQWYRIWVAANGYGVP